MISIDYDQPTAAVRAILDWIEEQIDLDHIVAVEQRHIAALQWRSIDRPPVTISAPVPVPFRIYPYHGAFEDPAKMLVNELVGPGMVWGADSPSAINSLTLLDDFPFQVRANYGLGIIASLFGAETRVVEDNMPWVQPIGLEALEKVVGRGQPDLLAGLLPRALETTAYYREALAPYPKCREAIHITQTDLQGPFDIAAQLWGSGIFTAFQDRPQFLDELLALIADTFVRVSRAVGRASTQATGAGCIYLHFAISPGNCLVKDDSAIMLSPRVYDRFIRPVNERVLQALGGGGIHWCGSGQHWQAAFLDTAGLTCVDWGNPERLNLASWEPLLRERRLPVSQMNWTAEAFLAQRPDRLFPTGAAFTVHAASLEEARRILDTLQMACPG
jgi:hypothetical protein